jgi:hypothetical protein
LELSLCPSFPAIQGKAIQVSDKQQQTHPFLLMSCSVTPQANYPIWNKRQSSKLGYMQNISQGVGNGNLMLL